MLHPFEQAGLGQAPFFCVGLEEKVIRVGDDIRPSGTCDYCGTGIRYACLIRSNDGRHFVVGCDCVRKLGHADNRLISQMERAKKQLEYQKKEAERAARRAAIVEQIRAREAAERERNGGLTDEEVKQQREKAARAAVYEQMLAVNGWLLTVLDNLHYGSDFVSSMISQLEQRPLADLSPRCRSILCDIYAKAHGRRGSKKYDAAVDAFWSHVPTEAETE